MTTLPSSPKSTLKPHNPFFIIPGLGMEVNKTKTGLLDSSLLLFFFFWERKMHSWHTTRHGGGPWIDRCTGNKEGVYAKWTMVKYGKEQDARRQLIKCGSWEARKRKYTATARGCKYCEIEADDDTRWCIYPGRIPDGSESYNQETRGNSMVWNDGRQWLPELRLHATAFWELEKVHSYKHSFSPLRSRLPAHTAVVAFCFLQFPKFNVQLMFDTHPLYIFIIYI